MLDIFWDNLMSYAEMEGAKTTEALLKEAGFTVSQMCCSRPSCFDFAARKNDNLIFIKVQSNIDNLLPNDSVELNRISGTISAASLLISEKTRERPLEDDTVYSRYNVLAVTPKTFENIMIRKSYPLIQAGPGGYYVEIDGGAVKRRRQELGLSAGEAAEMIGISRRTLYGYEQGMAKASVTTAYNLICILGIPVAKPVNVFENHKTQRKCHFLVTTRRVIAKHKFLMRLFRKSDRYGFTTVKKAPFDFVITVPEDRMRIIGGVAGNKELKLDRRVDEILSVSRVVQAHPLLITEDKKPSNKDISCIHSEELSKITSPEDLIENVT
jgi:putative transcriptional regulator